MPRTTPANDGSVKAEYAIEMLRSLKQNEDGVLLGTSPYTTIRNALLHAMIRSSSKDLGIKEIRSILKRANGEHAFCLQTEQSRKCSHVLT